MLKLAAAAIMLATSTAATAEWREATSKNFIVYSEGSEKSLREATVKLEKFDHVLRTVSGVKPQTRPVKLRIYLRSNADDVARSMPFGGSGVGGYYTTGPRGPFAVGVTGVISGSPTTGQQVLFHEYAHHFMHQNFPAAYPSWYSEGYAEYYGSAQIGADDVIAIGHAQRDRYYAFQMNDWLPMKKLLTARSYADVEGKLDLLYSEGWLLVHYTANNPERFRQLKTYLALINAGKSYEDAMTEAFGPDAKALDAELRRYAGRSRIMAVVLPFKPIDPGAIALRAMRPAEQALIEADLAMQSGIPVGKAGEVARGVRAIAARFPGDAYALSMLVEAERLVGNVPAARAAAERWLKLEPASAAATMHVHALTLDTLRLAGSTDGAAYASAREGLLNAHKMAPRDARILRIYYESFDGSSQLPPVIAQNALVRAFELVPQDDELRYLLARDFENRNMIDDAIKTISPAAFQLHGKDAETAREKKKKDAAEIKYRLAGVRKTETAREMLVRLEARKATPAKPHAASASN